MESWLRPILSRKQTSVSSSVVERPPSYIAEDVNDSDEFLPRIRSSSRISSYVFFKSSPVFPSPDIFPNYRQPETVWTKPSADQMVEALMVVMMNKSSMEPIPIEYNSTIMHILEAYNDLLNQIRDKDHAIHVLQQTHTKDVNDYEAIANAWCEKENEYKVEVKRLEILLSKTENGMETMFAARSNSVVHGSKRASESIKHGIGTIRARHSANSRDRTDNSSDSKESFPAYDTSRRDSELSQEIAGSPIVHGTRLPSSSHAILQLGAVATVMSELKEPSYSTQDLTENALNSLTGHDESQRPKFDLTFQSSESSSNSSSSSSSDDHPRIESHRAPTFGSEDKPLPNIPYRLTETTKQTTLDSFIKRRSSDSTAPQASPALSVKSELPFSFNPGDDTDILSSDLETDRIKRRTIDEHLDHVSTSCTISKSAIPSNPSPTSRPPSTLPNPKPRTGKKTHILKDLQDSSSVHRGDSSSSVVTAVRDNSARNSIVSMTESHYSEGPRLDHKSSSRSSEAVTAAARAFAEAGRRNGSRDSGGSWS